MSNHQISNVQLLRGVAALLVVAYHIQPQLNALYHTSFHRHFGAFGVDIFFVISGFVMYYTNRAMDRDALRFFLERLLRIVPLYWIATILIILLVSIGFHPLGRYHLDPRTIAQSLAFIPSDFPNGQHDLILTVGWTLMYELFFYTIFAVSMFLRTQNYSFVSLVIFFLGLVVLGGIAPQPSYFGRFITSPIIFEFLYGGALALLYVRLHTQSSPWLVPLGIFMVVLGLAIVLGLEEMGLAIPQKSEGRFLSFGIPALLVVGGALAMEKGGWAIQSRLALLLGAASYALYLFHTIILQILIKGCAILLPSQSSISPPIIALTSTAICVGIAILIHMLVERPILLRGKAWINAIRPGKRSSRLAPFSG